MVRTNLYDAQNYFRVKLEGQGVGGALTVRGLYSELIGSPDMNIMVWDGAGGNDKRKALYPEYKSKRKPAQDDIWQTLKLLREVLGHSKITQVCVPGFEADDVIAHLAVRLYKHGPVNIMSTDGDLMQLCVIPGVTHMKGSMHKGNGPDLIRLYKTVVGDVSDSIKGVPGFGEKTWEGANKSKLLSFIKGESNDLVGVVPHDKEGNPTAVGQWMLDNRDKLEILWKIVGFLDIDKELVDKHTTVGTPNAFAAEQLMREFFI